MADEKVYTTPGDHPRWGEEAHGIVPIGTLKSSKSLLTPEEQADNDAHDAAIAKARENAMKD